MSSLRVRVALVLAVLLTFSLAQPSTAAPADLVTTLSEAESGNTAISGWQIQSSAQVSATGEEISQSRYDGSRWYRVGPRSTVLAGLVQNGRYPNLFHGTNMRDNVNRADFQVPWWYRTEFHVRDRSPNTVLKIPGVTSRGEVFLNGTKLGDVVGTYNARDFDISSLVKPGRNALAIKVAPADPQKHFTISWIDWAQPAPDNNMGLFRDVEIARGGAVSLVGAYVHTKLALPGFETAELKAFAEVRNNTAAPQTVALQGEVASRRLNQVVQLNAGETRTVAFAPETLRNPRVWWPYQYGEQPLYRLDLTARVNGRTSDRTGTTFGIRDVVSNLNAKGDRQFIVNGKQIQIRGGGWASDLLLRTQPDRLGAQLRYTRDMGLNAIRLEGKLETPEFYELADRLGIMLLPGWECCDKWEPWTGWGGEAWTPEDYPIAQGSLNAQARFLRNHPSVIAFLIGSDISPPEDVQRMYLGEFEKVGWPNPVLPAASLNGGPQPPLGPSGSKMEGPYDWVPPVYWYGDKLGAAFGFAGELSAGHSIPALDTVKGMLNATEQEQLWREPATPQFHTGRGNEPFNNLRLFSTALAERYGTPTSLADYVDKAQLANYEQVRAQFEANARRMTAERPATGFIYWMLNNAWPSLNWHLYSYDLNPAGAYFGAKKANESIHIQYSYDDRSVVIVGQSPKKADKLTALAEVYTIDGKLVHSQTKSGISVSLPGVAEVFTLPEPQNLSSTYFVRLKLTDAQGKDISKNTYWLSSKPDVPDWDNSQWYYTPVSQFADLKGLATLPKASVDVRARSHGDKTTVTVRNTSTTIIPAVQLTLRKADGSQLLPVTWSDNYVALWPGESITVQASHEPTRRPTVDVGGINVASQKLAAAEE
ncbi:glycoside hydrolase family 2 protein [Kibdelosporangium aridum]|uniref:Exo-1,4-beta-D-glucosaminidase n=1 Tax=Kibdelosporangium aridum TaxID=2030 RepID=A0A1Y5Y0S4_KIBAR|nr:sugar-binding domain-containing protein [Kibdelosporangium aridum]SMD23385.1 exo-1,4-beta-D-glucosaminidase [Kibdelosporangium aridum]